MFVPDDYLPADPGWALGLVRRHPLALLVTADAAAVHATHLPTIPVTESVHAGSGPTGLVGTSFHGHMNRRNPHWQALRTGVESLLVFQGPENYISPVLYETSPAAPTWNFTAVHLRGTIELVDDDSDRMHVLTSTVTAYERDHGRGWYMADSLGYFDQLAPGVGVFRFDVLAADAMCKLSQEKTPEVRRKVIDSLADSGSGRAQAVAELMRCEGFGAANQGR